MHHKEKPLEVDLQQFRAGGGLRGIDDIERER